MRRHPALASPSDCKSPVERLCRFNSCPAHCLTWRERHERRFILAGTCHFDCRSVGCWGILYRRILEGICPSMELNRNPWRRVMKALFGSVFSVILVVVIGAAVLIGGSYGGLYMFKTFAPQWEDARTDVYRNSKSYVEGTIRDLRRLKREYETADESQQQSFRTIILQRSDDLDYDHLPVDIRRFLETL